jgi:hypothetical protein
MASMVSAEEEEGEREAVFFLEGMIRTRSLKSTSEKEKPQGFGDSRDGGEGVLPRGG